VSAGVQVEVCMLRVMIVAAPDLPVQVSRHVTAVYVISDSVAQTPSA